MESKYNVVADLGDMRREQMRGEGKMRWKKHLLRYRRMFYGEYLHSFSLTWQRQIERKKLYCRSICST